MCTIGCFINDDCFIGGYYSYYDYHYGPFSVTIPAGETKASFYVTIYDDNTIERNESFYLYIQSYTSSEHIIIGSINDATISIIDNDCKYVYKFIFD